MKKTVITAAITFATLVLFVITGCKKETPVIQLESTFFAENTEMEYRNEGANYPDFFFLSVPYTKKDIASDWDFAKRNTNNDWFTTLQVAEITAKLDGKAVDGVINGLKGEISSDNKSMIYPIRVTALSGLSVGKHQISLSCSGKWQTLDTNECVFNIFGDNTIDFEVTPSYIFWNLDKPLSVGEVRTCTMDSWPNDKDWYVSVDNNDIIKIISQGWTGASNEVKIEAVAQGRASLYYHSNSLIKEVKIDVL